MPREASHPVRRRLYEILERSSAGDPVIHAVHAVLVTLIVVNVTSVVLESEPSLHASYRGLFIGIEIVSGIVFTAEYAARLWCAPEHTPWRHLRPWQARLRWALHPQSLVDLAAILPFYLAYWDVGNLRTFLLLRLFRFFKLARYSPGLTSLAEAVVSERRALVACGIILLGTMLLAASAMNFAEREVQPEAFGTIPQAMYWAVVTLTTVGYGDVVPVTPLGRVIAGVTAIAGLVMLALPVGIIASAFAREIHRRDFIITWSMVARVPLFAELSVDEVASIMHRLRSQSCAPGDMVVRKGEMAHSMYLIASGEVELLLPGETVRLGPGDFFGERGVLERRRRSVTVRAVTPCKLLVLDGDDLHRLIEENPAMARHIARTMEERGSGRETV
ncbi:cyclic nucleotide-gated ion channel [Microvirga thermotolerans]|uniref:Cyclic nucleotide-binding domain-containing protein n=1 Tax=Microvirga thermotolerans TaxID=2651334 RepID=A0A5P9JX46_9HYPH|nr:cyclic nucleotide-gated ion channel [Microvirga thermotolerans]QFU15990.1 cyclic nucleotide-binding domain-containing protein [Microvirga thermotolerans]